MLTEMGLVQKDDGKGEEIQEKSPDSNCSSADDQSESETSQMGSPGSPSRPESPGEGLHRGPDSDSSKQPTKDKQVSAEEEGEGEEEEDERKESEDLAEESEPFLPSKRPRIMNPVNLEQSFQSKSTDSMNRIIKNLVESKVGGATDKKSSSTMGSAATDSVSTDGCRPTSPLSPITGPSTVKTEQINSQPPPLLTKTKEISESKSHSREGDSDYTKSISLPKLVPTIKSPGSERSGHRHRSEAFRESGGTPDRDRPRSRQSGTPRRSYSDRVRDHRHHRDSPGSRYQPEREASAHKSLAKRYADLFKSNKAEDGKRIKEEKASSSSCYEPLKAVQDMVKAAERRSPVTPPQSGYQSRFDYLKRLTGSPSSLEALQRVVEKDRSVCGGSRPSVVQSINKAFSSTAAYQKYLPLPPTTRDPSPPQTPDPNPDPDKPLDLSVKANKPHKDPSRRSSKRSPESSGLSYVSQQQDVTTGETSTSTIASLEQKFGDDSFMFDRIGSKHFNTPIRQFYMSAFGMGIYSTALNNSYPFPGTAGTAHTNTSTSAISQSLQASSKAMASRNDTPSPFRKSSLSNSAPPGEDSSKSYVPSKFLEQAMKDPGIDSKKHTNLQCSCGAEFETLYQLTLHLQETGHPANKTKNGTQHEYPKLVRGQDMWLNHGSEQTKQILRCMQCGESFKSLPELTVHMIQTKHYTNIVGAEPQGKSLKPSKSSSVLSDSSDNDFSPVHRCPKCRQLFEDFEGLIHHQETTGHLMPKQDPDQERGAVTPPPRPASVQSDKDTAGSIATRSSSNGSIVHFKRRLLDSLNDAAVQEEDSRDSTYSSHSVHDESSRIRCENCGNKISTELFVEHVRQCVKSMRSPRRAPSRSRSRSPIDQRIRDFFNTDYPPRREWRGEERHSRSRESNSLRESRESIDNFPYYGDHKPPRDIMDKWSHHSKDRPEPDSSQNTAHDYTVNSSTELVKPPDDDKDSCALKAMESFIERSFTHNTARKPVQSSSLFSSSLFARNFFASHPHHPPPRPPEKPSSRLDSRHSPARQESSSPKQVNSNLYQNKYLPPLYAAQSPGENAQHDIQQMSPQRPMPKEETKVPKKTFENGVSVSNKTPPPDKNDNTVIDTSVSLKKLEELGVSEHYKKREPSPKLEKVQEPADKVKSGQPEESEVMGKPSGSALQSLQGLVYGKNFNTEHPLDSLQKLIHTANATSTSHTLSSSHAVLSPSLVASGGTTTSLQTTLPGTVILVNPIVTVVANSKGGSPSLQISLPPGSPDSKDLHSPHSDTLSNHDNKSPTPGGDGDSNSENRCDACNRNFASKGSYRYHQSRCHWSTVKKYRIKEAINTSPYVYLPLDHSAKFNKYYEMANELAGKSK